MGTITKSQLALKYNISLTTLSNLLNNRYFEELAELGYKKTSKIIIPKVLERFVSIYGEPTKEL